MPAKRAADKLARVKGPLKSAKNTTTIDKTVERFTDEERAAMKEHAQELKTASRRSSRADKTDPEAAVLAQIAAMPAPDRALGERLHAIVKASAPSLSPKLWYGMPAYARDGKVVCFFQTHRSSKQGTRRSASCTRRTSTMAPCGRPRSH